VSDQQRPPRGVKAPGRLLWDSITTEYELTQHELALLTQAVRVVDHLEALDAEVRRDGVTQETPQGLRAHPALVESRAQKIVLARLLAALRMPLGEEGDEQGNARRPQRQAGAKGVYGIRGAAS